MRTKPDYRALAAKFIYFCEMYGLSPADAMAMMLAEDRIYADEDEENHIEQLRWAIGVTRNEPWAMAMVAHQ
jgi:hypothetical protein